MKDCGDCRRTECRCADCFALIDKCGKWFCDEYENYCEEIEVCGEYSDDYENEFVCDKRI